MAGNRRMNEKAELPPSTRIDKECVVAPLRVQVQSKLREMRTFVYDEKNTKRGEKNEENVEEVVPSKVRTIGQSIEVDENTERKFIQPTLNHTSNARPSSSKLYNESSVLLCPEAVASKADNMQLPIPNFSHPIAASNSAPPQLPTPDLSPPYPPPAHFSNSALHQQEHLQHPIHISGKALPANLEIDLHAIYDLYSTCTSKPKPCIADFPPPPTTALHLPNPPQSHINFSSPKPKQRRTNWALEEHFPFTPLQRMKRKHRKRLYGALFAIFFVSTLGAAVGFLIHGVGNGKRASASDTENASPDVSSVGNPNGSGSSAGAPEDKKAHIMWMVIIGGILMGCHAIFAVVMFVLYGPCGLRRKKYVRDGRGGAIEVPREGES